MAKSLLVRLFGLVIAVIAAASLLLTGYVLLQTWRIKGRVTASLQSGLDVISSTLTTTTKVLDAIDQSLEVVSGSLSTLQGTAQTAASSLHSQAASIQSLATLFGKDLPDAMTAAQIAMINAQTGAKEVEDTLTVLTSNPAFGATPYQPAVSLSTALSGVATGLGALPTPMQAVGGNLTTTSADLSSLETSVTNFSASLGQLRGKLDETRQTVQGYKEEVARLSERLSRFWTGVPGWVGLIVWVVSFLMLWLGILQVFVLGRAFRWMMRG